MCIHSKALKQYPVTLTYRKIANARIAVNIVSSIGKKRKKYGGVEERGEGKI
jgi:hypothetical protein